MEALAAMERAIAVEDRMIGQVFSISSESQRSAYINVVRRRTEAFLSLVSQRLFRSAAAVRCALDVVLRRKAIEAEALATQRDAVLGGKYPALASKLREITVLRSQIAQKTLAGPGPEGLQAHQAFLAEWNSQREQLEAFVARQMPEMNLAEKLRIVDRQAIAVSLDEGMALVSAVENICSSKLSWK